MKRSLIIQLLFWRVLSLPAYAQQVSFIKYTVHDGLVANPVRCIYQDNKGFIWIGTIEGLSRFDGYKFTNYTNINGLSHNVINSIIEVDGKLLIAENNGAVDVIQNNRIGKGLNASSAVNVIASYNDRLLVSTDANGFYEYRKDSFIAIRHEKTGTPLGHFIALKDSILLSDAVDDHLVIYNKNLSIAYISQNFSAHFYNLFRDSKDRIWACTSSGLKLLRVNTGKSPSVAFAPLPGVFNFSLLNNAQVTSMIEQNDGSFWIGTLKGLVHLLPDGNFHVYNEKEGLPSAIIQTLTSDKENNLWIGTGLGLAKWVSKNNVVFYNTENRVFKNDVISIYNHYGKKIILGTNHGIQQFDLVTKEFRDIKGKRSNYGVPIQNSHPLLVHFGNTIGKIDSLKNSILLHEEIDLDPRGIVISIQHPVGAIFVGKFDGLEVLNGTTSKKLLTHRITSLVADKNGNVWAGTWNRGLFMCSRKNHDSNFTVRDLTYLTKELSIRGLYADSKNNIWVGTRYAGAFCVTPKANEQFEVRHFNRMYGLMSDWVSSFAETDTGDMWIGSYQGIDKLVKTTTGYRVFNFSKVVNFFAEVKKIIPAGDNEWVCMANTGIAYFKDENLHQTPPFQPSILSANLGVYSNKMTIYSPTEKISLKPNQNAASFEFSALGFINERQILYSYRLQGSSDTSWSKPANIHEASYASLSPGHYRFEVKTIGWNGEDSTPASFSFYIKSPFWQTWWFIGLSILVVGVLFYTLYKYRISQLLKLQKVRNNIATDLHDDIGSSLTNISILSELSAKNISDPVKTLPFLLRISEEVQSSSQAMDDIIWSVNSRNDSLQETIARMRRYAAELFDNSETACHLQLNESGSTKKLSIEQRRDIYLIYKEALSNIQKHANANNVWIRVVQHHNQLLMEIKDDGKGFNTSLATHRNGLKNLRSRVDKWKGKIKIDSLIDRGTTIEINLPLKD